MGIAIEMGRFTTILWDLDQTILDFKRSQEYALSYCFEKMGLQINDNIHALYVAINDDYWDRLEKGEVTKEELFAGRYRTLFEKLNITGKSPEKMAELYQEILGSVYFFLDEADKIIMQLKEQGYKQYIVTNGFLKTQANKIRISGLDKLVDASFASEEIGYPKPRKEYFDACFARMKGITREECILVGDSLTSDMQGGIGAGIATCWYNPTGKANHLHLAIDHEIRDLHEVPLILQ